MLHEQSKSKKNMKKNQLNEIEQILKKSKK